MKLINAFDDCKSNGGPTFRISNSEKGTSKSILVINWFSNKTPIRASIQSGQEEPSDRKQWSIWDFLSSKIPQTMQFPKTNESDEKDMQLIWKYHSKKHLQSSC